MTIYTVGNISNTQVSNVNAGGIDIPPRSVRQVDLADIAELPAVCANASLVVMKAAATYTARREAARVLKYRKSATGAAL
jgi:hypothetical protein